MSTRTCILCLAEELFPISARELIVGVTSDCKPWPRSGLWVVCRNCGHIQKVINESWINDVKEIYHQYDVYHLSEGAEQAVFLNHVPIPRTMILVDKLRQVFNIADKGKLLDIGCGNGAFLYTFGREYPRWGLFGFEQSDNNRDNISGIPNLEDFYSGSLECITGHFDIIVMTYVIEHLVDPVDVLEVIKNLLTPGGILFVQTSDFLENPFDMVITDHCSHFMIDTLKYSAELSGIDVISTCDGWIQKEIGFIGKPSHKDIKPRRPDLFEQLKKMTQKNLAWLEEVKSHALTIADKCEMGIFGTAIAGTWLANTLKGKAGFFVDEDSKRHAKTHMGCQVLQPSSIPEGSFVYLAFPYKMAINLYERFTASYPSIRFIKPPAL